MEKWDPKLSETSRSWRKSTKGVLRVSEVETDMYSNPLTTTDGMKVTKVVEQVERRKHDWSPEDQESLVPVTARERF